MHDRLCVSKKTPSQSRKHLPSAKTDHVDAGRMNAANYSYLTLLKQYSTSHITSTIMFSKLCAVLVGALLAQNIASYPGHHNPAEITALDADLNPASERSLAHCAENLKTRGIHKRNLARHSALTKNLCEKRGLAQGLFSLVQNICDC